MIYTALVTSTFYEQIALCIEVTLNQELHITDEVNSYGENVYSSMYKNVWTKIKLQVNYNYVVL